MVNLKRHFHKLSLLVFYITIINIYEIHGRVAIHKGGYEVDAFQKALNYFKLQPIPAESIEVSNEIFHHIPKSFRLDLSSDNENYGDESNPTEPTDEMTTISNNDADQVVFDTSSQMGRDDIDEGPECEEAQVIQVSCNSCVCINEKYVCSKKDCKTPQVPLPPRQKGSSKRKGPIKYHSSKKPGSDNEIDTNTTITEAPEVINNATSPSQCIDGRTKPVDCNQCVCALGKWACTKRACIALTLREKASYSSGEFLKNAVTLKENMKFDEDCSEGQTKAMGCNQCVCHLHSWACSDFECPNTPEPEIAPAIEYCKIEEDVKSKDCNICSCRKGVWVCTENDCKNFGERYYNPVPHRHQSKPHDEYN